MSKIKAQWVITLNVECPFCATYFDMLKATDEPADLYNCLWKPEKAQDVETTCPGCRRELVVDLEW